MQGSTLIEQIASAFAQGKLDDWRRSPVIPRVDVQGDAVLDKPVTMRDLLQSGAMAINTGGRVLGVGGVTVAPRQAGGGATFDGTVPFADDRPTLVTPPTPTDLRASGTFKHVILTWKLLDYKNHAYVEVWRNTTNNLGAAVMIGTAVGDIYLDETSVELGTTYYYWVRAVGSAPATSPGAFNAVDGTTGGAGKIGHIDLGPLIIEADNLANAAVQGQHLSAGSIAVGSAAIANGAIRNALIENLAVDTAKIADLAVATAKLADLAATTAKIADLAVTNAKIANLAVGSANIQDLAVVRAKIANLAVSTAQIDDLAVTRAKIANLAVSTAQIDDLAVTNAKISGDIQSDNFLAGSAGWRIQKSTGGAEFGAASIRGQIVANQIQALNIKHSQTGNTVSLAVSSGRAVAEPTVATVARSVADSLIDVYANARVVCTMKSGFGGPPAANYQMEVVVNWNLWNDDYGTSAFIGTSQMMLRPFIDASDSIVIPVSITGSVAPPGSGNVHLTAGVTVEFTQPPIHDSTWGPTGTVIDAISTAFLSSDVHMIERKV